MYLLRVEMAKLHTKTGGACICCDEPSEKPILLHKTRRQTHSLCLGCTKGYLLPRIIQIADNVRQNFRCASTFIKCPGTYHGGHRNQCCSQIDIRDLPKIEPEIDSLVKRVVAVLRSEHFYMCPNSKCPALYVIGPDGNPHCCCPLCRIEWCCNCMVQPYHLGLTCIEHEASQAKSENGRYIWKLHLQGDLHFCPSCKVPTVKQKDGKGKDIGCNKMSCKRCRVRWCWLCREMNIDYSHYNPNSKTRCGNRLWEGTEHE